MAEHDHAGIPSGTPAMVITISDGAASGAREDEAGVALATWLAAHGFGVTRAVIPDNGLVIQGAIVAAAAEHALVVTTGGTGLTPRDVTPQSTLAVIDYEVPGLAEAMRAAGRARTPMADLSRGIVGVLEQTLIVNVPGSPRAALENIEALEPTLVHALETLRGPFDHNVAGAGTPARPDLPNPKADPRPTGEPRPNAPETRH